MYVKSKTVRCATHLSIIELVRRNQQLFSVVLAVWQWRVWRHAVYHPAH